jgi:hypothetical protein
LWAPRDGLETPLRGGKECMPRDSGARMSGVATYQGRALAEINLTGLPLAEALEAYISRRDPSLENVQVRRATPTGDVEMRVQPHKRWYEVVFEVDDNPDEEEDDDDDDTFEARKKAAAKAKAAEKARVKDWTGRKQGVFPPSERWPEANQ